MKKLPLLAAAALAAGVAGAVLGMAPSGADPDDNNIANVTGEPYGKAVAILHAMGYKAVFGGAVGGDVPQSQCVVSSQKMIAGGSNNGAIGRLGPTNGAKMQLMLDCTQAAQASLNQGSGPVPVGRAPAQSGAGAPGGAPGIGTGDGGNRPTPGAPGTVTVIPTQVG
ncbi:MAG: hypothetical protein KDB72_09715 [Mycobacterium sp.]|nr:hypothetical protein [Mycobacterium sp.]